MESGNNEVVTIKFERPKSGLIEIDLNQDGLLQELNGIHEQLIPVEKKETIEARHQKKLVSAAFQRAGDLVGIGNPVDLFSASGGKYTKTDLVKSVAGKVVGAAANFAFSAINAKKTLDQEIEKNNSNIKKLAKKTNPKRKLLEIAPIDISKSRTLIEIDNFTIGEDILLLDDFGKKLNPKSKGINGPTIKNGAPKLKYGDKIYESFEIHLDNTKNESIETKIATISLDPASIEALNSPIQRDPTSYLPALLYYDKKLNRWVLGNTLFRPSKAIHSGPNYTGGPAGELVILKRDSSLLNSEKATLVTRNQDDIVFGSTGNEHILTSAGMDQITPNLGNDTINAGDGIDKIDFQDIKQPIHVLGSTYKDLNSDVIVPQIQVTYRHPDQHKKVLASTSFNTEVISTWGPSIINLSEIARPNDFTVVNTKDKDTGYYKEPGYYGIRTGLGSNIKGSPHSDRVFVSLMKDENDATYLDTNESCKISLDGLPLKILKKPAIINGGNGEDELTFLLDSMYPIGSLEILSQEQLFNFRGANGISRNGDPVFNHSTIFNPESEEQRHGLKDYYLTVYTGDEEKWNSENRVTLRSFLGDDVEWSILEENELRDSGVDDDWIESKYLSHKHLFQIFEETSRSFSFGLNFKADHETPKYLSDSQNYGIRIEAKSKDSDAKAYYNVFFNIVNKDKSKWPSHLSGGSSKVDLHPFKNKFNYTYRGLIITNIVNAPAGLQGYKAVIKNDTVIAFVKDIDVKLAFARHERDIGTSANFKAPRQSNSNFWIRDDGAVQTIVYLHEGNPLDMGNLTDSCALEKPIMYNKKSEESQFVTTQFEQQASYVTAESLIYTDDEEDINIPEDTNTLDNEKGHINEPNNANTIEKLLISTFNIIDNSKLTQGRKKRKEIVRGSKQNDVLLSGRGKDKLLGRKGSDIYWIKETENFKRKGIDIILDFNRSQGDLLLLNSENNNFKGLQDKATYSIVDSRRDLKLASKSDVQIVYYQVANKTGRLYYNHNNEQSGWGKHGGSFLKLKRSPDLFPSDIQLFSDSL